jgi:uncharacterized MnhB-related membrane protein
MSIGLYVQCLQNGYTIFLRSVIYVTKLHGVIFQKIVFRLASRLYRILFSPQVAHNYLTRLVGAAVTCLVRICALGILCRCVSFPCVSAERREKLRPPLPLKVEAPRFFEASWNTNLKHSFVLQDSGVLENIKSSVCFLLLFNIPSCNSMMNLL